ncbi:MAG: tetratricopeptide repeat protein [Bacteroidia bacterium]|nr:tetratricopeptide repeat protein [Bacteroidia bacterium]
MMKNLKSVFLCAILSLLFSSALMAGAESAFEKANLLYREKKFEEAGRLYATMLRQNETSYILFYNLGNCFFKQGKMAEAILNYERAKALNPTDEDILFNLRIAYSSTVDKIEPIPLLFYQRWWQSFLNLLSPGTWSILALSVFWLAAAAGSMYLFARTVALKRNAFLAGINLTVLAAVLYFVSYSSHHLIHENHGAVVLQPTAYIKSSPDAGSTNLFMLHEGTKIEVTDELPGWKKIRIANGNVGWVESTMVENI